MAPYRISVLGAKFEPSCGCFGAVPDKHDPDDNPKRKDWKCSDLNPFAAFRRLRKARKYAWTRKWDSCATAMTGLSAGCCLTGSAVTTAIGCGAAAPLGLTCIPAVAPACFAGTAVTTSCCGGCLAIITYKRRKQKSLRLQEKSEALAPVVPKDVTKPVPNNIVCLAAAALEVGCKEAFQHGPSMYWQHDKTNHASRPYLVFLQRATAVPFHTPAGFVTRWQLEFVTAHQPCSEAPLKAPEPQVTQAPQKAEVRRLGSLESFSAAPRIDYDDANILPSTFCLWVPRKTKAARAAVVKREFHFADYLIFVTGERLEADTDSGSLDCGCYHSLQRLYNDCDPQECYVTVGFFKHPKPYSMLSKSGKFPDPKKFMWLSPPEPKVLEALVYGNDLPQLTDHLDDLIFFEWDFDWSVLGVKNYKWKPDPVQSSVAHALSINNDDRIYGFCKDVRTFEHPTCVSFSGAGLSTVETGSGGSSELFWRLSNGEWLCKGQHHGGLEGVPDFRNRCTTAATLHQGFKKYCGKPWIPQFSQAFDKVFDPLKEQTIKILAMEKEMGCSLPITLPKDMVDPLIEPLDDGTYIYYADRDSMGKCEGGQLSRSQFQNRVKKAHKKTGSWALSKQLVYHSISLRVAEHDPEAREFAKKMLELDDKIGIGYYIQGGVNVMEEYPGMAEYFEQKVFDDEWYAEDQSHWRDDDRGANDAPKVRYPLISPVLIYEALVDTEPQRAVAIAKLCGLQTSSMVAPTLYMLMQRPKPLVKQVAPTTWALVKGVKKEDFGFSVDSPVEVIPDKLPTPTTVPAVLAPRLTAVVLDAIAEDGPKPKESNSSTAASVASSSTVPTLEAPGSKVFAQKAQARFEERQAFYRKQHPQNEVRKAFGLIEAPTPTDVAKYLSDEGETPPLKNSPPGDLKLTARKNSRSAKKQVKIEEAVRDAPVVGVLGSLHAPCLTPADPHFIDDLPPDGLSLDTSLSAFHTMCVQKDVCAPGPRSRGYPRFYPLKCRIPVLPDEPPMDDTPPLVDYDSDEELDSRVKRPPPLIDSDSEEEPPKPTPVLKEKFPYCFRYERGVPKSTPLDFESTIGVDFKVVEGAVYWYGGDDTAPFPKEHLPFLDHYLERVEGCVPMPEPSRESKDHFDYVFGQFLEYTKGGENDCYLDMPMEVLGQLLSMVAGTLNGTMSATHVHTLLLGAQLAYQPRTENVQKDTKVDPKHARFFGLAPYSGPNSSTPWHAHDICDGWFEKWKDVCWIESQNRPAGSCAARGPEYIRRSFNAQFSRKTPRSRDYVKAHLFSHSRGLPAPVWDGSKTLRDFLKEIFKGVQAEKGPAWGKSTGEKTKGEWLAKKDNVISLMYRIFLLAATDHALVAQSSPLDLFKAGLLLPEELFGKDEIHFNKKVDGDRLRIIWNASIQAELIMRFFHNAQNKLEIELFQDGYTHSDLFPYFGSCVGMGHHDLGNCALSAAMRAMLDSDAPDGRPHNGVPTDPRGWDISVTRALWMADGFRRSDAARFGGAPFGWCYAITNLALIASAHVVVIGKEMFELLWFGVMPSGIPSTSSSNSFMRCFVHSEGVWVVYLRVGLSLSMGDDNTAKDITTPHMLQVWQELGVQIEGGAEAVPRGSPVAFTSHLYHLDSVDDRVTFDNGAKLLLRLAYSDHKGLTRDQATGIRFAVRHTDEDHLRTRVDDFVRARDPTWILVDVHDPAVVMDLSTVF